MLEPHLSVDGIEVFVLATCLRVELAWAGEPDSAPAVLDQLYGSRALPSAKTRTDLDAFHHLARVAAGLESAQIGEPEVLTQFRQSLDQLAASTNADHDLVRTMETAVGVARFARRSLVDPRPGSLATAAARLVGGLPGVVVIGGGAMGRAVVRELESSEVVVLARRPEPVAGVVPRPLRDLPQVLATCRAVVSTVPGPVPMLELVERGDGDPLLLVDLGMPPAVEAPDPSSLVYHGVDDVASTVPWTPEPEAERLVAVESEKAWRRLTVTSDASSIIASLVGLVDRTVDDEVRRFAGRLSPGIEEPALRQLAHTVARRIIHPSVSLLGSSRLTPAELDVLARALGVDRD